MSLFFRAAYLLGFKPWDSGVPPPELVALVEGAARLEPGRALDLGCGTGTVCVYLSRQGWDATGVDFVGRAVGAARRRAAAAGSSAMFMRADATRLPELGLRQGFDLVFDQGCLHSVPESRREAYVAGATALARQGATFLLFGFTPREKTRGGVGPRGLRRGEVEERFAPAWDLVEEVAGTPTGPYDAAWYRLRRR